MRIKNYICFSIAAFTILLAIICLPKKGQAEQEKRVDQDTVEADQQLELEFQYYLEPSTETVGADETFDHPVLNVITENPALGDEHLFLRICKWNDNGSVSLHDFQTGKFTIKAGESYSLMIYYHNAASEELVEDGIAEAAYLAVAHPMYIESGGIASLITASIVYGAADGPYAIADALTIEAEDDVILRQGIILDGAEPEYTAMQCNNYGEKWLAYTPAAGTIDGITTHMVPIGNIMPGYEGAGFIFIKLDAIAVE